MLITDSTDEGVDPSGKFTTPLISRLTPSHWLVLALILLLYIVDGLDMQILGVTVSAISGAWRLPLSSFGAAMAAGHAGSAVGAVIGGILGDRLGRRPVMMGGTMLFGLFTACMIFATVPSHLVIMRFLAGIGLGGCLPPGLALLSECMPPRFRSFAVSLAILCAPLGIAIAGFLASALIAQHGWQVLYLIAGFLPFLLTALFWFTLPESPAFLLKIGGHEAEVRRLNARFNLPESAPNSFDLQKSRLAGIKALIDHGQMAKSLCLFGMFFVCYLSMSMVLSWLPALLSKVGFGDAVSGTALATWALTGMGGVLAAGILMSRFGTQKIVGSYLVGSILVLSIVAIKLPQPGDKTALMLFYFLIATGGFMLNGTMTTIYAHAAEAFPTEIRSTGIGLSAMSGRLGAISGAFVGASMLELSGANGFFAMVAAALLFAFLLYAIELFASRTAA